MIEGTCKTCKWWRQNGVCDLIELTDEKPSGSEAVVFADAADDHNLHAELRTGPDFGCTSHRALGSSFPYRKE